MSTYFLLLEAVRSEDLGFLQDFFKENFHEINLDDGDEEGVTCVHIAAGLDNGSILEYLLNRGSSVDIQTQEGLTPLHIAAMWGRSEQVAILLNHGADCSVVDNNGYNAVMHAIESQEDGSQACIDIILSHQENRNGYLSGPDEFLTSNANPNNVQTTPESEPDFEKLNSSPWITPRRGSKNSRRNRVNIEKISKRLSTKFESITNEDPNSLTEEYAAENVETSGNLEEFLTELSSGLLSSSGQDSSTDSNCPTFSYSTITCLDSQRLASLTNVECSEYGTVCGLDILTECSTSDDSNTDREQGNKGEMKIDECGNRNIQKNNLRMELNDDDEETEEGTCVYETADEEIEEDLKKRKQYGNSDDDIKEGRIENGKSKGNIKRDIQGVEESIDVKSVSKFGEEQAKKDMKQAIHGMKGMHVGNVDNGKGERKEFGNAEKVMKRNIQGMEEGESNKAKKENTKETRQNMNGAIGREKIVQHNLCAVTMDENEANGEMNMKNNTYAVERSRNVKENENKKNANARRDEKKESNKEHENKQTESKYTNLGQFEEEKRNDVTVEKEEQNKACFNINTDFNDLNRDENDKPTTNEHKHLNDSFNPKLNQSGLPLNSTFLVDSPLQHLSKQATNFFIPIQNVKPPISKANPSVTNPRRNNGEETIIYDWRELSMAQRNETMAIIPASYKKISCNELRNRIKDHGQIPGPITHQTKMLYVKKLWRLDQGIGNRAGKDSTPVSRYPVEIRMILTGRTEIPDCNTLEQEMMKEFCKSPRKVQWRGGTEKSSFNYLLLDPRVTLDLPQRSKKLSFTEAFRCFILSIFYVGKGKRSRPYAHLHEAIKYSKSKSNTKLEQILEIWRDNLGVISLHMFQSAIPVEAFTREACMVEALGLSQLTNQKRGEYYGLCAKLDLKKKRKLGIFLLLKAYQIFLQEGERQIGKEDL